MSITRSSFIPDPFSVKASRAFRFCVPDEWYRRSKSRDVTHTSLEPSESTIRRLVESNTEAEEGTARFQTRTSPTSSSIVAARPASPDWRASISQARLSSIFDVWKLSTSPTSSSPANFTGEKKIVSEPRLVEQHSGSGFLSSDEEVEGSQKFNSAEFEQMLVRRLSPLSVLKDL
jgi:diaphanous 1